MMEERVHEVLEFAGGIPVLAIGEVALDDGGEGWVGDLPYLLTNGALADDDTGIAPTTLSG